MDDITTSFSFWLALVLAIGTLAFYLSGALWVRVARHPASNQLYAFNLAAPTYGDREELFAVALVAAGTSLSTVFLFFLTAGSKYGWWIALCPILFAAGNYLMFGVYKRVRDLGYFEENAGVTTGAAGLLPYLGERLTGSKTAALVLLIVSLANLLAVLVLELTVGVEVFTYLTAGISHSIQSPLVHFTVFAVSLALLLGYVFVGGFAAVVASDLWQLKIISWAVVIALISLVIFGTSTQLHASSLHLIVSNTDSVTLVTFLLGVVIANLLVPLSQEASWQRFRAFSSLSGFNVHRALAKSIGKSILLWFGLIFLAVGLRMLGTISTARLDSMSQVLEAFRLINDWWFPLAIFPILTIAALSAMYSTSDTCVSSILYLVDYAWATHNMNGRERIADGKLPVAHYWAMGILFLFCLSVFAVVRYWFHPTILQLVFSVFSNLIVIAPTVLLASWLPPLPRNSSDSQRARAVVTSLLLGSGTFWAFSGYAIIHGGELEWLSQIAIVPGLLAAVMPLLPLSFDPGARGQVAPPHTLH